MILSESADDNCVLVDVPPPVPLLSVALGEDIVADDGAGAEVFDAVVEEVDVIEGGVAMVTVDFPHPPGPQATAARLSMALVWHERMFDGRQCNLDLPLDDYWLRVPPRMRTGAMSGRPSYSFADNGSQQKHDSFWSVHLAGLSTLLYYRIRELQGNRMGS